MVKPIPKEVMIDVKMLTNPKKCYKVQHCVDLTTSRDVLNTIAGSQRPVVTNVAIDINNLKENVAIILQTLKNKCVINVDPAQQDIAIVQDQLGEILSNLRNKMKKSYDEVIGLVVGGRAYDKANKFADRGVQLTDAICEFMEIEHIPSTKLIEQNPGRHTKGIDLYSHKRNAVLSGGIINDFIGLESQNPQQIQALGEKSFDIFEISPLAPIRVVDEVLPDKSTNLRFL